MENIFSCDFCGHFFEYILMNKIYFCKVQFIINFLKLVLDLFKFLLKLWYSVCYSVNVMVAFWLLAAFCLYRMNFDWPWDIIQFRNYCIILGSVLSWMISLLFIKAHLANVSSFFMMSALAFNIFPLFFESVHLKLISFPYPMFGNLSLKQFLPEVFWKW